MTALLWAGGCGGSDGSGLSQRSGGPDASVSTGGTGGASAACAKASDCSTRTDGKTICDSRLRQCVQCATSDDCAASNDCVRSVCWPIVTCQTSLDCGGNLVCDTAINRCAECVTDADCGNGLLCRGDLCRLPCVTDKQCTPDGLLCSTALGACVECLDDTQCLGTDVCVAGACVRPEPAGTGGATGAGGTTGTGGATGGTPGTGGRTTFTGGTTGAGGGSAGTSGAGGSTGSGGVTGMGGSGGFGTGGLGAGGTGPGCGSRLDMWIIADVSGSTNTTYDTGTTWGFESAGIQNFVNSRSGIGVGMVFAPSGSRISCCTDADCGGVTGSCVGALFVTTTCFLPGSCGGPAGCVASDYSPAAVPLTLLPDTGGVIAAALAAHGPGGGSMGTAVLDGTRQDALGSYAAGGRTVLVLMADGDPTGCSGDSWTNVGAMAQTAATGTPPLPTFIVTLGWDPSAAVQSAAQLGGTTAIGIPAGLTLAGATDAVTTALDQIATIACQ